MPRVWLLLVRRALRSEQLERRQPHPIEAFSRPAVPPVRRAEEISIDRPPLGPREQFAYVKSCCHSGFQRSSCYRQGRSSSRTDSGVLISQQFAGLRAPWQQLGIEQQPRRVELLEQSSRSNHLSQPKQ
jgi:hypothetical protein